MLNAFMQVEFLEPKCPGCRQKLDYGTTTRFSEQVQTHVCNNCGTAV